MFFTIQMRHTKTIAALVLVLLLLITSMVGLPAVATGGELEDGIRVPIIMYHAILKEESRQSTYVISPQLLENDLKYLTENGYTSIVVQDLIDYVDNGTPLPEKPIMLTFDDGYYNNYLYAYPLMQKYGMKMVLSPIGYATDQYTKTGERHELYSHVTWNNIKEMIQSGAVEIQNHSYSLHGDQKSSRLGAKKKKGESAEQYASMLKQDLSKMQNEFKEKAEWTPTAFFYPFGIVSKESLPVVRELGFRASFTCEERMNYVTRDPESLYLMGRYLRPHKTDSASYFKSRLQD